MVQTTPFLQLLKFVFLCTFLPIHFLCMLHHCSKNVMSKPFISQKTARVGPLTLSTM